MGRGEVCLVRLAGAGHQKSVHSLSLRLRCMHRADMLVGRFSALLVQLQTWAHVILCVYCCSCTTTGANFRVFWFRNPRLSPGKMVRFARLPSWSYPNFGHRLPDYYYKHVMDLKKPPTRVHDRAPETQLLDMKYNETVKRVYDFRIVSKWIITYM